MRLLHVLTAALLSTCALAASRKSTDKFLTFHSKALSTSPIDIDDRGYEQLTSTPRDYSVTILLTALEARYGCQLCRDFQSEWQILGSSWTKGDKKGESRVIFGTLDFARGKETFQKVMNSYIDCSIHTNSIAAHASNCTCSSSLPTHNRTQRKG
jgi:oligosaccharyltransferase complex subunit gamma